MLVIDGDGAVLGRLAALLAKRLLLGESIAVVNAEKVVVSGKHSVVKDYFYHKRERGDPIKGPFYPKYPDRMLKRVVKGMLPVRKLRGREALKRLRVYIGCPEGMKGEKLGKTKEDLRCKYTTLGNVSTDLGAKKRW